LAVAFKVGIFTNISLSHRPLPDNINTYKRQTFMFPAGFETVVPGSE